MPTYEDFLKNNKAARMLADREMKITFPKPVEGQTHWSINSVVDVPLTDLTDNTLTVNKPMSIKDTIRALPKGEDVYWEDDTQIATATFEYLCLSDDLKALVDSHDDLKAAISRFIEKGVWYNSSRDTDVVDDDEFNILKQSFAEAENL